MLVYEGDSRDFDVNIRNLATHLQGKIRTLESQRARISTSPDHPDLRANATKALDDQLGPLRLKAEAAENGQYFADPRDVENCDPSSQRWASLAIALGRYVTPDTFEPSLHDTDATAPIKVIRGGTAKDLGSPTMSVR